jgi:flagellar biosynthesis/type III secretory pathway chaperone
MVCLVCQIRTSVMKEYNIRRQYEKEHIQILKIKSAICQLLSSLNETSLRNKAIIVNRFFLLRVVL